MKDSRYKFYFWMLLISALTFGPIQLVAKIRADENLLFIDPFIFLIYLNIVVYILSALKLLLTKKQDLQNTRLLKLFSIWIIPVSILLNYSWWLSTWMNLGKFYAIWILYPGLLFMIVYGLIAVIVRSRNSM